MTKPPLFVKGKKNTIIMDRSDPHAFDGVCELCGIKDELRPYGPKGKSVCFDCAMKDEETAKRQLMKHMNNPKKGQ
jgi:hypothetical protein